MASADEERTLVPYHDRFGRLARMLGYRRNGKVIEPMMLGIRPDQHFEDYATAWERKYSQIINQYPLGPAEPLIDTHFRVLAHVVKGPIYLAELPQDEKGRIELTLETGQVVHGQYTDNPASEIKTKGKSKIAMTIEDAGLITQAGHPAFSMDKPRGNWYEWLDVSPAPRPTNVQWLVTVNGEVMSLFYYGGGNGAVAEDGPQDYIMMAYALASLGKAAIGGLIRALTKKAITMEAGVELSNFALQRAARRWRPIVIQGGLSRQVVGDIAAARRVMQNTVPRVVNRYTNTISAYSYRELKRQLEREGFALIKAEKFGPEGGYQMFFQRGNVVARFKSMGDKFGPRMGRTHLSFSLNDGKGLKFFNDMAKLDAKGAVRPRRIVDAQKFTGQDPLGDPSRFDLIDNNFDIKAADSWADATHFSASPGFKLDGVADDAAKVAGQEALK